MQKNVILYLLGILYPNFLIFIFVKVKIMAIDVASLERAKAIISGLTMVPSVGDIYRYVSFIYLLWPKSVNRFGFLPFFLYQELWNQVNGSLWCICRDSAWAGRSLPYQWAECWMACKTRGCEHYSLIPFLYRNCFIFYSGFHIRSFLSFQAYKVGDRIDVKLIEVSELLCLYNSRDNITNRKW